MRLSVRVSAAEARERLSRRRPLRWRRGPETVGLDLVRLPAAVARLAGSGESGGLCVVERILGHAWLVAGPRPATLEPGTPEPEAGIVPRLALPECAPLAAACLGRSLAAVRAAPKGAGAPACVEASYPFWVLYLRRRGRIDLRVLDAVTGRRASSGIRAALVTAFLDAAPRTRIGPSVAGSATDSARSPTRRPTDD